MAAQDKVTFKQDLTEPVKIRHYEGVVFTGDDCGNLIKVALFDGGVPYSGGGTVSATAVLADGTTFPLTQGSITGNMVSVPLEAGALAVSGLMGLYVKISGDGIICTVLNAIFTVQATDTGMVSATMATTVNELVQEIKDAQDSFPADLTNLLAAVAPTFSTSTAYSAGAYIWQGGKLYRFTAAHPAGTWTGTDAVEVALGNDVADLKSALGVKEGTSSSSKADTSGTSISASKRVRLNETAIPPKSLLGTVKMIPFIGSGTANGVFELATLSGNTYTVYKTIQFSINPSQVTELQDIVNLNTLTTAPTYIFIALASDATSKFRANSATGEAMVVGDDIASTSFTTRNVNNYELAYSLTYTYSELFEDIGELQQRTSDISTIRANASKVDNYPFATQAELKVNNIDFSGLKTAIKDIRLFGANLNDTYWIYTYLVNFGDAGTYSIEIRRESDNKNVCGFSLTSVDSGYKRYRLNEQSNSGISGEVVWNPAEFTTSYYFSQTAYTQIARECLTAKDVFDMKYLIENVLCIGDSLTQGYIKPSGGSYYHTHDSYPSILKKICNADTVTNRGASGFAASNYYSQNIVGHPNWFVWANYDFVIVWLGTNNGLDTQEQQEAYNNIISAIQTGNANAKIFLCTCFSTTGSSLADTNAFIRTKNLPVIDMNVAPFNLTSDTNIHPDDVTHFGDVGYTMVAEYIVSEICKYISAHLSEYNHIGRPVT